MRINSFDDNSSGFDPRNYAPIGYSEIFPAAINYNTSEITAFSVTGEGFIDLVVFNFLSQTAGKNFIFKFIIDDVVYTFGPSQTGTYGFSLASLVSVSYAGPNYYYPTTFQTNLMGIVNSAVPFTKNMTSNTTIETSISSESSVFFIGSIPLFFEKSFVVKYTRPSDTVAIKYSLEIMGGLLI